MSSNLYGWCSWCHENTRHRLENRNYLSRNEYRCTSCGNYTVQCRYCKNMATFKPAYSSNDSFFKSIKRDWASELCAEHDGTIADFEKLDKTLYDLVDYTSIFKRAKCNIAKGGKIAAGMIAGGLIVCPLAFLAAPGVASALGSLGVLGAASTGTIISTLSGAALTSASLAALGPGGVVGGVILVTAVGTALGGTKGGVVSNSYFGEIQDFKITKVKEGSGPALIFINGFLSQKNQDPSDWINAVSEKYPYNPYYYVNWESSSLYKMGKLIGKGVGDVAFKEAIKKLVKKGSKEAVGKLNPLATAQKALDLVGNPWHTSMYKSGMTGILLADLIARTDNPNGFILMGHSLGARVIYYLLCALSKKNVTKINDVYLLGGAVDRKDLEGWNQAVKAVNGKIINCYSNNDSTLKFLYKGANALLSSPIGLGKIESTNENIINLDVSSIIDGHMQYKQKFSEIIKIIDKQ